MSYYLRAAFVAVLLSFALSAVAGDELLDEARALRARNLPENCSVEELREYRDALNDLTERGTNALQNAPESERAAFFRELNAASASLRLVESCRREMEPRLRRNRFDVALEILGDVGDFDALQKILAREQERERFQGSLKMASDALYKARASAVAETKEKDQEVAFADEILETSKTNALVREQAPALFAILGRVNPELGEDCLDRFIEQRIAAETLDEAARNELRITVALARYQLNLLHALDANDRKTSDQILRQIAEDVRRDPRFAERALSVRLALQRGFHSYMARFDDAVGARSLDATTEEFRKRIQTLERALNASEPGNLALCRDGAHELEQMIETIDALVANGAILLVDASSRYVELCAPAGRIAQNLALDKDCYQRDPETFAALLKTLVSWLRHEEFQNTFFLNYLSALIQIVPAELAESTLDDAETLLEPSARFAPFIAAPFTSERVRRFCVALDEIARDVPESERQERMKNTIDAFLERAENNPPLALQLERVAQLLEQRGLQEQAARAYRLWLDAYDKFPGLLQSRPEEVQKRVETKRGIYYGKGGNEGKAL